MYTRVPATGLVIFWRLKSRTRKAAWNQGMVTDYYKDADIITIREVGAPASSSQHVAVNDIEWREVK